MREQKEITVRGKIHEGEIFVLQEEKPILSIMEGEDVVIRIKRYKNRRSLRQNAYYNGVVIPYIIHWLYDTQGVVIDRDTLHEYHLVKVGLARVVAKDILGEKILVREEKRTKNMNTEEMRNFITAVVDYWAEYGLMIPEPKEEL